MGIWDPEHFLIHVRGAIHAIKEMELDTKFQEAMKAVKSAILEVVLTKMHYKNELKEREDDSSQQAVGAGKAAPEKSKKKKRQRVRILSSQGCCSQGSTRHCPKG